MTTTINFLQRDERDKKRADSIREIVVPITTALTVVYLIIFSGLLGWWWWWNSRQERVSAEYASLKGQVDSKQSAEVLARRMVDRITVVNEYINARVDIFEKSEFLNNRAFTVTEYGMAREGYFFVEVAASESATVADLGEELARDYEDVMVKKMTWDPVERSWTALYWYRGDKKNG